MSYMPTAHLIMFKGDVRGYIFYSPFTHLLVFLHTFHFYILQLLSTLGFTSFDIATIWHCNDVTIKPCLHIYTVEIYLNLLKY